MKCIILCMCCNDQYYLKEFSKLKQTWAKDILDKKYDDLDIWGYTASQNFDYQIDVVNHMIYVPCTDSIDGTLEKTKKAIQALDFFNIKYDWIVKTNCSTIINVKMLNEFINSSLINQDKIYVCDLFVGGWKSAPEPDMPMFRGNFIMFSKQYSKLINDVGLSMAKQINNYDRIYHRDLFCIDDTGMAAIFNTYLKMNNIFPSSIYQRIPTLYYDSNNEGLVPYTIAIPVKPIKYSGSPINSYFEEIDKAFDEFNIKYADIMSSDINQLQEFFRSSQSIFKYQFDETTNSYVTINIPYKEYDDLLISNNIFFK